MMILATVLAALVVNGDFEHGSGSEVDGWSLTKTGRQLWRVEPGAGVNGNRGLVWESATTNRYSFPVQEIRFTPGKRYRFEAQIKTELAGLKKEAGLFLAWYDASGKFGGDFYTARVRGTNDWAKAESVTKIPIPQEAVRLTVAPFVHRESTGRAMFDDISVTEYEQKPLGAFASSAYRNLAAEGTVKFFAPLFVETNGFANAGWKATFEYSAADGTRKTAPADFLSPEFVALSVRVEDLAMGEQEVFCSVATADGKTKDSATLKFTRVAELPPRRVYVDSRRRLVVDGKPFFPLGMYSSVLRPPVVREYAKGPFNCILPYNHPSKQQLDLCDKYGLKVVFAVNKIYVGWRSVPKGIKTEADELRWISERLAYAKGHPAMLGWYLADELSVTYVPRLAKRTAWLAENDPDHPTFACFCRHDQIREYLPSADVIGTDVYPIPGRPLRQAFDITRITDESLFGARPLWQVPQAFTWGDTNDRRYKNPYFPTKDEMRAMCWQMIASGANGLIAYALHRCMDRVTGDPIENRWADVCTVYSEIVPFIPVLLSGGIAPNVRNVPPSLAVRTFREGADVWVLVCNLEKEKAATSFAVDDVRGSAEAVYGAGVSGENGDFNVSMEAFKVCLVHLKANEKEKTK